MTTASRISGFTRALRAELAKLGSVRVLLPAVMVPAGYVMLKAAVFLLRGEDGLGPERYTFGYMFSIGQFFWDRLLIPLLAVTICAWLVWLESDGGNWKLLLVQPVPRGSIYLAKLVAACAAVILLQGCWWSLHSVTVSQEATWCCHHHGVTSRDHRGDHQRHHQHPLAARCAPHRQPDHHRPGLLLCAVR